MVQYMSEIVYVGSRRSLDMATSYKKLWKMLIDKDLKNKDLEKWLVLAIILLIN